MLSLCPIRLFTMERTTKPDKNTYALVTGGSSGMGLEYVKQLAPRGYNIIIVALYQNETDAVKDEMAALYPDLDFVSIGMDLSEIDSAKNLYEKVFSLRPEAKVEVLINNAGVLFPRHFRNMSEAQVSKIILIHNHTLALMCHYFIPAMAERGRGYVLNISSLAAWFPYPFISTYSATKAFTKVFTRAIRTEYWNTGVYISTIYFGAVSTNLYDLSSKWRKIAIALSVMLPPEKAVHMALKMMFRGRTGRIPGVLNVLSIPITAMLPHRLISRIEKKVTTKWNFK